jgi:aminoglycoside phosphotransferase (APT) family kinase protein
MPAAEVDLDADRVRALLREQFPDLAELPLTLLANGWDNTLMRLGDELLIRLPRREAAARLVAVEQQWLPRLAPRLPLPIPAPVRLGRPGRTYPWPWSIVQYVPGTDAAQETSFDTYEAARALGGFLGSLHRSGPPDAPKNPVRGVALQLRDERFHENLRLAGGSIDTAAAEGAWRAALDAEPWKYEPVWLHGDLHPANLLVRDSRIVAVVDFGDLTTGDPATDLAVAWMVLPRQDRPTFWRAYSAAADHPVDAELRQRSRGWAIALAAVFLAHSADNPKMWRIGQRTAAAVLEPDDATG